ncbi:MAG: hypothetical protein K2Q10_06425, partial [Rhodospirillales bacterium]|nr:hypothetical protein [Rhodospirillales bacterium]
PLEQRIAICKNCKEKYGKLAHSFGFPVLQLRDYFKPEMRETVKAAIALLPTELAGGKFTHDRFVKAAARDIALFYKTEPFGILDRQQFKHFEDIFTSVVATSLLFEELIEREQIDRLLVYNDYSINHAARAAAIKKGAQAFCISNPGHNNNDRRFIAPLHPDQETDPAYFAKACNDRWPEWRAMPVISESIEAVGDDTMMRFSGHGSHTYSPPKTGAADRIFGMGKLSRDRKLLVAYTSALDEQMASRLVMSAVTNGPLPTWVQPFPDQITWLEGLIDYVAGQPDLQLVVRIHPREGANKREGLSSKHLGMLRERFGHRHMDRVWFLWPEDKISSYDLGEMADLVLTSWSTIGLELARLGVPVIAAFRESAPYPVDSFTRFAETAEDYFMLVGEMTNHQTSLDDLILAYRWYHSSTFGLSVDLRDMLVPPQVYLDRVPRTQKLIEQIFIEGRDAFEACRQYREQEAHGQTVEAERRSILR